MFGKFMRLFRFLRSYSYYNNLTSGPVIPIKTNLGINSVTLHADGRIEGDFAGCEHWLKSVEVRTGPEDRIIFWLLLQHWRKEQEMEKVLLELAQYHSQPHPAPLDYSNSTFDPAPPVEVHPEPPVLMLEHPPSVNSNGDMVFKNQPILQRIPTVELMKIGAKKPSLEFEHV